MRKRRAYRATAVKKVSLGDVFGRGPAGEVTVGLDIGKKEVFAVLRWKDGTFLRPWKAKNPSEIRALVQLLQNVAKRRPLRVATFPCCCATDWIALRSFEGPGQHRSAKSPM